MLERYEVGEAWEIIWRWGLCVYVLFDHERAIDIA